MINVQSYIRPPSINKAGLRRKRLFYKSKSTGYYGIKNRMFGESNSTKKSQIKNVSFFKNLIIEYKFYVLATVSGAFDLG